MSERNDILMIFPIVLFAIGVSLPVYLIGLDTDRVEWGNRIAFLMYLSMFVLLAWPISIFQRKNEKFKYWATDSVTGVSVLAFAYSFLVSLIVSTYLLIPAPGMVLFALSIAVSLAAFAAFMGMGSAKGS